MYSTSMKPKVDTLFEELIKKSHAIVNEAVNLSKKKKGMKTSQFINAVLKNAFQNKVSLDDLEDIEKLSVETSHPLWLIKKIYKQYGYEKTKKICYANNEIPYKSARINILKCTKKDILKNSLFQEGKLSQDCVYYNGGNIAHTDEFKKGLITIQDESSQLVARLLEPTSQDYVLDMCCAPGSKTTHLAAIMNNQGKIVAYDLFEHKIKLVKDNLKRLGVNNVELHAGDATLLKDHYPKAVFDKILLDAPCSGLGVMKRKPEIKYHDSSAMDTIIPLQAKLLDNAYYLLKKGGRMVYSTCTINKKENELMIKQFLEKYQDMKIVEEKKILPYIYDSDGFYMCKLEKGK